MPPHNCQTPVSPAPHGPHHAPRLLITAGPTHEPIDRVRYLGNRSSGRLGIALAEHAADTGWHTTLLLGPTPRTPRSPLHSHLHLHRFQTTADLETLLGVHFPLCDCLIMAAAVADYRPKQCQPASADGKLRRENQGLTLHLEPTPDLLAGCAAARKPGQTLVGFALEPRSRLLASATDKLTRKGLDLIVANPLETMDSDTIEATLLCRAAAPGTPPSADATPGPVTKEDFADWLLARIRSVSPARR